MVFMTSIINTKLVLKQYYCGTYHRVVSPGEYSEAVLVLTELLLDLRPHAFALTLQHDEDGLLVYLQQMQKALSKNKHIQAA